MGFGRVGKDVLGSSASAAGATLSGERAFSSVHECRDGLTAGEDWSTSVLLEVPDPLDALVTTPFKISRASRERGRACLGKINSDGEEVVVRYILDWI